MNESLSDRIDTSSSFGSAAIQAGMDRLCGEEGRRTSSQVSSGLCGTAAIAQGSDVAAILDQRGERYGKFCDHAAVAQRLKTVMRNHMGAKWERLADDQKEALEMIAHKLARIANGDPDYADSWVDIAGYSKLVADRLEGVAR